LRASAKKALADVKKDTAKVASFFVSSD